MSERQAAGRSRGLLLSQQQKKGGQWNQFGKVARIFAGFQVGGAQAEVVLSEDPEGKTATGDQAIFEFGAHVGTLSRRRRRKIIQ